MKIRVVSDLHIDINNCVKNNYFGFETELNNTDVILIAGDISGSYKFDEIFLERIKSSLKNTKIFFVNGNHTGYDHLSQELYEDTLNHSRYILRQKYNSSPVCFLENNYQIIDDYIICGCTLYTDFNLYGKQKSHSIDAELGINDFRYVLYYDNEEEVIRPVCANDYIRWFNFSKKYIKNICQKYPDKKIIVLTHFQPSPRSISYKYIGNKLNPFYCTNLENFILKNNNIKLWVAGHVHDCFDYKIGDARIVCEPYGYYGYEQSLPPQNYFGKIIDI